MEHKWARQYKQELEDFLHNLHCIYIRNIFHIIECSKNK